MQALHFTVTIPAPVARVRDTMLNHPTYEQRTTAFSEGSTYTWSREQDADITFLDPSGQGMIAKIAESRLHEYVSIHHLGQVMMDPKSQQMVTTMQDGWYENYTFTALTDSETKIDVEMTAIPDEWTDMMNDMRPKALELLKNLAYKNL